MTALPSTFEKKWPTIFQVGISVVNSLVVVASASGFHAKQIVTLTAPGQPALDAEVKRVVSDTQLKLGPIGDKITVSYYQSDLVYYIGGSISALEQNRNPMGADAAIRAVYQEEPAVAFRTINVDEFGEIYDSANPIPVQVVSTVPINQGGKTTVVAIDNLTWTALPPASLAARRFFSVQNRTGQEIKVNFDNTAVGYVGVAIDTGTDRFYDNGPAIIYAKSSTSACSLVVEELT